MDGLDFPGGSEPREASATVTPQGHRHLGLWESLARRSATSPAPPVQETSLEYQGRSPSWEPVLPLPVGSGTGPGQLQAGPASSRVVLAPSCRGL